MNIYFQFFKYYIIYLVLYSVFQFFFSIYSFLTINPHFIAKTEILFLLFPLNQIQIYL